MLSDKVDPCKGCVCAQCKRSDYNAAVGVCYYCGCDRCGNKRFTMRRSLCELCVPVEDNTADLRL